MLDLSKIRAIGLDLDDTLWPVWPVIERAELRMQEWLAERAPVAGRMFNDPLVRLELRRQVLSERPDIGHDMSALRQECIRLALDRSKEDTALAGPAFEVFFEARMQVDLFADALPALQFLARRFPIIAVSNGNADVHRVGIGAYFSGSVSAYLSGFAKPDVRIFQAAAKAAGVAAAEVLHIGDDPELDVLGALAADMQTAWINRENKSWEHDLVPHASVPDLGSLCRLLGQ